MNTYNLIIFLFIFFFLNTSPTFFAGKAIKCDPDNYKIHFIKQNWHTAIVFNSVDLDSQIFREYNCFKDYNLIDIGWGDEEFYQYPGFDSGLAFRAIFYPTPSALRVEGINLTLEEYFNFSEVVIELDITREQLLIILNFINDSFLLQENNQSIILSKQAEGKIIFFKAVESYHLLNTCNTWLAKCLNKAGFNIEDNIILTEQLFNELFKIGIVLKPFQASD